MLKIKLLKILVLLFAIEYVMSKTYLIETTAEEENGKYYTNTRKVILIIIKLSVIEKLNRKHWDICIKEANLNNK